MFTHIIAFTEHSHILLDFRKVTSVHGIQCQYITVFILLLARTGLRLRLLRFAFRMARAPS